MTASPRSLPIEARRLLWQRLWDRLLAPPATEPLHPDDEADADDREATECREPTEGR